MKSKKKKVVVAMSGGVDSSVAVALLKRAGFDVVGIFMKFWQPPRNGGTRIYANSNADLRGYENRCCSTEAEKRARQVAKILSIPFYVVNVEKEFKKKVVDYFLKEYKAGNTPNPCVVCNKEIKFGFLIKKALSLGADFVATGHYAKIRPVLAMCCKDGPCNKLIKGKDKNKDQSYFLWQLNQKQLKHIMFPVGDYTKLQVRALAKKFKLPTAKTPESQEVCFIHPHTITSTIFISRYWRKCSFGVGVKTPTGDFLEKYLGKKPGKIIDTNGKVLGEHQGLWFYTIGQRKGIDVPQGPYYVVGKDFKKNALIVSKDQKDLENKELIARNVNWTCPHTTTGVWCGGEPQKLPISAEVKIRYKSNFAKARILKHGKNKVKIIFQKSQRAVTPGQSVVFYRGQELLGGGVIK